VVATRVSGAVGGMADYHAIHDLQHATRNVILRQQYRTAGIGNLEVVIVIRKALTMHVLRATVQINISFLVVDVSVDGLPVGQSGVDCASDIGCRGQWQKYAHEAAGEETLQHKLASFHFDLLIGRTLLTRRCVRSLVTKWLDDSRVLRPPIRYQLRDKKRSLEPGRLGKTTKSRILHRSGALILNAA